MYKKHMKFNLKVTMINLDYRGGKQRQHESSRFTLLVYFGEGPKRETHADKNATTSAVVDSRSTASGQRVVRSTTVKRCVKPCDCGRGPTRSTCT